MIKLKAALVYSAIFLIAGSAGLRSAILMDFVTVGDIGNLADATGYGAVNYEYRIGKYEVTIGQYASFLNAVASTDTYGLYNSGMATDMKIAGILQNGSPGAYTYEIINNSGSSADRPITYVNWFDAARFVNWLSNGQPNGPQGTTTTEDGAYSLNGAISGVNFTKNINNPNTGQPLTHWIPTEDEWYKAAYYKSGSSNAGYWIYPTQSNSIPSNVVGFGVNQANYMLSNGTYSVTQSANFTNSQTYLTNTGAFPMSGSPYGTFDQGGNVREWTDVVISGSNRGYRGGSWDQLEVNLRSTRRLSSSPTLQYNNLGFRVVSSIESAAVPEIGQIGASCVLLLGLGIYWLKMKKNCQIKEPENYLYKICETRKSIM